jgi:hypothetical protein
VPSDVERFRARIAAIEAGLQPWHAHACLDPGHSELDLEDSQPKDRAVHREVRALAALVAMYGIALVVQCTWAVNVSQRFYVHAASFRAAKVSQDWCADSLVPAISRVHFRSRPLQFILPLLCVIGFTCNMLVLYDQFEPSSVQEGIACFAVTLTFPPVLCITASLNAKTVRRLLKEFETLYVVALVLGMVSLQLLLFRGHPAKMGCIVLSLPSLLLSGFIDAYIEGGRVLTSRVFFCLNLAGLLIYLALFTLKLGAFADYTSYVRSFAFVASSILCNAIATLVLFDVKNLVMSLARPGSLVTLISDVCCILLDHDAFALLKAAYSLLGLAYGKRTANRTVLMQLHERRASIAAQRGRMAFASSTIAPAPSDEEVPTQPRVPLSRSSSRDEVHAVERDTDADVDRSSRSQAAAGGSGRGRQVSVGAGCPPFGLDA